MATQTTGNRFPAESQADKDKLGDAKRDLQEKAVDMKDSVKEKAGEFKETVTEGAGQLWGSLKEVGTEMKNRAAGDLENMRGSAAEYVEEGQDKVREIGDAVEQQIRSQPLTSVLLSAGVGFLFGAIWCRR